MKVAMRLLVFCLFLLPLPAAAWEAAGQGAIVPAAEVPPGGYVYTEGSYQFVGYDNCGWYVQGAGDLQGSTEFTPSSDDAILAQCPGTPDSSQATIDVTRTDSGAFDLSGFYLSGFSPPENYQVSITAYNGSDIVSQQTVDVTGTGDFGGPYSPQTVSVGFSGVTMVRIQAIWGEGDCLCVANFVFGDETVLGNSSFVNEDDPITDPAVGDTVASVLQGQAVRNLRGTLISYRKLTREAADRLAKAADGTVPTSEAFDITGDILVTRERVASQGDFFQRLVSPDGEHTRIVSGDFNILRDVDGSGTTSFNGQVIWERPGEGSLVWGHFVSGEYASGNIVGSYEGDHSSFGAAAGAYVVSNVAQDVFASGYASIGFGMNNIDVTDGAIVSSGDYTTRNLAFGGSVMGVYALRGMEIRSEVYVDHATTRIGEVDLGDGPVEAGDVALTEAAFRPEFRWSLDGSAVAVANRVISFAPRAICERVVIDATVTNCGRGAELALEGDSDDGLGTFELRMTRDWIADGMRTNYRVQVQRRF